MTTVYNPRSTVIRGVEKNHTARTLHDLDATAKLRLVKDGYEALDQSQSKA